MTTPSTIPSPRPPRCRVSWAQRCGVCLEYEVKIFHIPRPRGPVSQQKGTQVVNEYLFPSRGDSYMISCYFISLMKIHKKQNGQLARPFILRVLTVSYWRVPFSGYWAGPTVNCRLSSEVPSLPSCPCAPCHTRFGSSHVSSASVTFSSPFLS